MTIHFSTAKVVLIAASTAVAGAVTSAATNDSAIIALIHEGPQLITSLAALISAIVGVLVLFRVQEVHTLTNRNFSEQKQEIVDLRLQLAGSEAKVDAQKIASQQAESTRSTLAAEAKADKKP